MARFTLEFNQEAADTVNALAQKKGTSKSDVIRRALNLLSYVEDQQEKNAKILVVDPNGDTREIVPI
jgi:Arc/MetJ-type ribon-helix-helix transcriptional regulator